MYRVLLTAAAITIALSMSAQAGGYDDGYASEPGYRHHARHTHRAHTLRWRATRRYRKPYHMGVGGLIVVDEPYGERMYEHAVRTRDRILWGR